VGQRQPGAAHGPAMRQSAGFIAETKPKMVKILANHHIFRLFNFRTPRYRW
jgi:hypothetical protein